MERIKQAIEKAKHQHQPAVETSVPPAPEDVSAKSLPEIGDISYSKTRVIELNPEHLERNRIVAFNKNGTLTWVFDLLRTQVLQKMEENGWRTLAVTSPTPGAGKTVVAINLAMSIAHHTMKTAMLVDFDLRRPKVGAYLGIPMDKSMNDILADSCSLGEALINPGMPRLVVLPTREPVSRSAEALSSPKVSHLIAELRERYDSRIVIIDLPPLLGTDDTIAILPKIDCVLMVVGNGLSTKQEIEDGLRHLPKVNLIGTVLNKADIETQPYAY